jgi:cell division protein FtsW (lipid II flippase)
MEKADNLRKMKRVVLSYHIFYIIFMLHLLSKEVLDADDISMTSAEALSLNDYRKESWLFRQGLFYGGGIIGAAFAMLCLNINWIWSIMNYILYCICIFISLIPLNLPEILADYIIIFVFSFVILSTIVYSDIKMLKINFLQQ